MHYLTAIIVAFIALAFACLFATAVVGILRSGVDDAEVTKPARRTRAKRAKANGAKAVGAGAKRAAGRRAAR